MATARIDFQDNFESGDATVWSSGLTDTGTQADFPHFSTLSGVPGMPAPYSGGAYCFRVVRSGGTANSTLIEADLDINTTITNWVKFNMWISPDFKESTTADDNITIFESLETGSAVVFAFGIDYVQSTDLLKFGVGGATTGAVPTTLSTAEVPLGKWFTVELKLHLVTASAAGDITAYITEDGQEPSETATVTKASVQGATVTSGVLGVLSALATTKGTILFDNFQWSGAAATAGARIYPTKERFSVNRHFIRAGTNKDEQGSHIFVGPGTLSRLHVTGEVTAATLVSVYDTDTAQTFSSALRAQAVGIDARNSDLIDANSAIEFKRGCYVTLATSDDGDDKTEIVSTISRAPNWFSDGNIRRFGQRRNLNG